MPIRNHIALDEGTTIEERTKNSRETLKQLFWQTSINKQRPKSKIGINDTVIECLVDTVMDVTIIAPKLASSGGKSSAFRNWNVISGKTEHTMGQMYRTRRQ